MTYLQWHHNCLICIHLMQFRYMMTLEFRFTFKLAAEIML